MQPRARERTPAVSSPVSAASAPRWPAVRVGRRACGALVGLCVAVVVLGPALRPGYLLFYDMVFVPHLDLSARTLGVDGSVPRAVPSDLVVAIASQVMPGWMVQKVLLILIFVGVGYGVGALMSTRIGATAAAVCATWNPYVAERLAIGHWNFLLGYAVLPFLVAAANDVRLGRASGRYRLGLGTVVTAMTGSTGALIGLLVTFAILVVPSRGGGCSTPIRRLPEIVRAVGIFVLANAVWWFPSLFLAPVTAGDKGGVTAFAARADTPLGPIASIVTGGGIWNAAVWTPGRASVVSSSAAVVVALVSVACAIAARSWKRSPGYAGLMLAGLTTLILVVVSALPVGQRVLEQVVDVVPGAGLLRDSQKFLAVWVLVVAVCAGLLSERVQSVGRAMGVGRIGATAVAAAAAMWPVAVLPGLAWAGGGQWSAVDYPASYLEMRERVRALPVGAVAVFPWTTYRRYGFNENRILLDPWQRLLGRKVLTSDDLPLASMTVRGEDPAARAVAAALESRGDVRRALMSAGVRFVLLQTDQPSTTSSALPSEVGGSVVAKTDDLTLTDLGTSMSQGPSGPRWWAYSGLVGSAAALVVVLVGGSGKALSRRRGVATSPEIRSTQT